jgi:hypothetical protein
MRPLLSFVLLAACAAAASAQVAATVGLAPDGSTEITLRNDGPVELTAYAIRVTYHTQQPEFDGPIVVYVDPVLDTRPVPRPPTSRTESGPIAPGGEFTFLAGNMVAYNLGRGRPVFDQPIVAGIFADGSTTGDTGLLTLLMLRRSNMLAAVETSLEILTAAAQRGTPPAEVAQQLDTIAATLRHWYLPKEQTVGLELYESIIARVMALPEERADEPSPLSTLVAEERPALLQRRALLLGARPGLAAASA